MTTPPVSRPDAPAPIEPVRAPAYFVAATGNDSWSGRLAAPNASGTDGPFATLTRARDAMRASDVDTTYVRGGTYTLTRPLELTSADNGVAFRGYPGETAVISGGERVTGFRSEGGGLFSAAVSAPTDLDLVIGGIRQTVSQSGDRGAASPKTGWLFATADGTANTVRYQAGDVAADWAEPGVLIQTFDRDRLADSIVGVERIDPSTSTIHLKGAVRYTVRNGGTYRLLNNDDLIRDPGEFGWRSEDARLVVKPEHPESFEHDGVVVPRLATLVSMTGVTGATLFGLTFADATWAGTAVELRGSNANRIGGNHFLNVGNGLSLSGSSHNLIDGNVMEHLGGSGLDLTSRSNANTVYANRFAWMGEVRKSVGAVTGNGIDDTLISHNDISHSPAYGVSLKNWNSTNVNTGNVIEYNRIQDVGRETADSAAIEMLGRSDRDTRAVVRGNHIDGVAGLATAADHTWLERHKGFGIYLDDQTNGVTVTDNFLRDVGWAQVFIHGGDNNLVENNIGLLARDAEEFIRIEWVPLAGDAGIPRNNTVLRNVISAAVPVDDYWELWSANAPRIERNLVCNTPRYSGLDQLGPAQFVDPQHGDFRLTAEALALPLGLHDLAWEQMGRAGYTASGAAPPFWVGAAGLPASIVTPPPSTLSVPPSGAPLRVVGLMGEGGTLQAALPAGIGLQAAGPAARQSAGEAPAALAALLLPGGADPSVLDAMADFAGQLPTGTLVGVRTVRLSSEADAAPAPILISDAGAAGASAVVIDTRGLAPGALIRVDALAFAAILGPTTLASGPGAVRVAGDRAAQTFVLGAGNDTLSAGAGDDRLFGGAGDDALDGGPGVDVVRMSGRAADYTLGHAGDGALSVHDRRADGDGRDALTGIEVLRFADGVRVARVPDGPVTRFDEAVYLRANPDVAAAVRAGAFASGLHHLQQFGWAEGRHALLSVDDAFYRAQNPDVDAAIEAGVLHSAQEHFAAHGATEGRSPHALFDASYYLSHNADVAAAVQAGSTTAYGHFSAHGWREGRDPSPWFDTSGYLRLNPDVALAGVNPLLHFLDDGMREGRLAPPADTAW